MPTSPTCLRPAPNTSGDRRLLRKQRGIEQGRDLRIASIMHQEGSRFLKLEPTILACALPLQCRDAISSRSTAIQPTISGPGICTSPGSMLSGGSSGRPCQSLRGVACRGHPSRASVSNGRRRGVHRSTETTPSSTPPWSSAWRNYSPAACAAAAKALGILAVTQRKLSRRCHCGARGRSDWNRSTPRKEHVFKVGMST